MRHGECMECCLRDFGNSFVVFVIYMFLTQLVFLLLCFLVVARFRCGPCLIMAPEFEEAAQALKGKVRFVKLDTDKEEQMAARLAIMGLPTLLFLDKFEDENTGENAPKAVLKGRIEGALQKDMIMDLCEHHFFGGPEPKLF